MRDRRGNGAPIEYILLPLEQEGLPAAPSILHRRPGPPRPVCAHAAVLVDGDWPWHFHIVIALVILAMPSIEVHDEAEPVLTR